MGRLTHSVHTRELGPDDWALPAIQNITQYETSSSVASADFFNMPGSPTGQTVNDRTAMRVSAVASCVEKIAIISSLPKHIYELAKDGTRERVTHDLWPLLNTEPSAAWTASSFWERMIASMLLRGDGMAQIVRSGKFSNKITELKPLTFESVIVTKVDGRLKYRIINTTGETITLDQVDVLHFPGFGFNGFRGMSVIQYAAHNGIGIALAADGYSAEFFGNGQRPDYLLTTDGSLTKDQATATKEALENQHRGIGNRFKPLVLQGGLKMQPLTMSAADSQLLETRKFQVIDICMAFGVPPQLIGAQDSTAGWAGSSLEQLNIGFLKYTLRGHIARLTQEINRKLLLNTPYFCEFNLDAFLEGDSTAQALYLAKAAGGPGAQGWMSVNEIRRLKNLPADNNTDYDNVIRSGIKASETIAATDPNAL